MKQPRFVDALSPLDAITGLLLGIAVTALAVGLVGTAFGEVTMFDMGSDDVCVQASFSSSDDTTTAADRAMLGLGKDVTVHSGRQEVCKTDPSPGDQVLTGLTKAPPVLVFVGFLILTRRIIAYARRNGLFSAALAQRIERLGWLLLLGLLACSIIGFLASGQLQREMLPHTSWASGSFDISIAGVIGAYGIVTVGRVMGRAANLQADADATI